ncbi:MAG: sel1 repeat family protein, partial [Desulfobacteraceae bacterium]
EKILDSVTPLYKHRMDKLSPQQQEIVDCIALNWDAITTKEIAKKTRIQSKAVSAQLGQLEKFHIIEKEKTDTKNHLYRIHERFFNIWYLMRLGRTWDERRVRFIVEFLQIWCDEHDLEKRANRHLGALKQGKLDDRHAFMMTEALVRTQLNRELQNQLIETTRTYLESRGSVFCGYLSPCEEKPIENNLNDIKKAEIVDLNEKLEQKEKKTPKDLNYLGILHMISTGDIEKAEIYLLQAVEQGHVDAMFNLALLYQTEFKDMKKAEAYYLQAVEKGHAGAMFNLALLYQTEFKDMKKAEAYYLQAVEKGHAGAMNNLADLYRTEFKDMKKAKDYYLQAAEKGHAGAMNNLALLYETEFKDMKKAEAYYLQAVEKGDADAMNNLAYMLFEQRKNKEHAIKLSGESFSKENTRIKAHTHATILLWDNQFEKCLAVAETFLRDEEFLEKAAPDVNLFLMLLIAKKQFHSALRIFNETSHQLKDRFKPVYYALMGFMKDEYPNEYRKMGGELKETVDEIVQKIKDLGKKYQ